MTSTVAGEAARLWRQVEPDRIAVSWRSLLVRLLLVLVGAQQAAAGRADGYLTEVLDAQGLDPDPVGGVRIRSGSLAGVASDGRDLSGLLYRPVVTTLAGIGAGATVDRALAGGAAHLDMIVRTQVADAGRVADQVALTARPSVTGYVRMVVGGTCSRCILLAGQRYRWNTGFQRHPNCDCVHVPAAEDTADDVRTDPRRYFGSLDAAEQDRVFTKAGAEVIRDGADIGQVVNARRGMYTAADGRKLTREGARRRRMERLMPEQILRDAAGNRDEAIRLLRQHGYLI
ncbi:hypothetical protein ACQEVC_45545 [Plantactinospora sp. CA-294935]|uniref:VG15 protein n=1 Tax=Plantactinospora sp. CA-294935 TaxID=3240012 RepID=UPI003D8CB7D9